MPSGPGHHGRARRQPLVHDQPRQPDRPVTPAGDITTFPDPNISGRSTSCPPGATSGSPTTTVTAWGDHHGGRGHRVPDHRPRPADGPRARRRGHPRLPLEWQQPPRRRPDGQWCRRREHDDDGPVHTRRADHRPGRRPLGDQHLAGRPGPLQQQHRHLRARARPGGGGHCVLGDHGRPGRGHLVHRQAAGIGRLEVDSEDPTITITAPADGATYQRGALPTVDFECLDEEFGSGVDTCVGTYDDEAELTVEGYGEFEFTVTATDFAGNEATETITYTVARPRCAGQDVTVDLAFGDPATSEAGRHPRHPGHGGDQRLRRQRHRLRWWWRRHAERGHRGGPALRRRRARHPERGRRQRPGLRRGRQRHPQRGERRRRPRGGQQQRRAQRRPPTGHLPGPGRGRRPPDRLRGRAPASPEPPLELEHGALPSSA